MAKRTAKRVPFDFDQALLFNEIQKLAYQIYQQRVENELPGDDIADWLLAEKKVKDKHKI